MFTNFRSNLADTSNSQYKGIATQHNLQPR